MSAARQNANPVLRKLESIFRLSEVERAAVEALPMQVQTITADQDIVHDLVCLADLPSTGPADPCGARPRRSGRAAGATS